MNPRTRTSLTALLSTLALAACAGDGGTAADTATADETADTPATGAELSEAETTYLTDMVPHHAQAVEMAELVPDRAEHDELRDFATGIVASQTEEISQMEGLLGEEAGGMDHSMGGGSSSMTGMMSDEDMTALEGLTGNAFDLRFLEMMTVHHMGALEMSAEVLAAGPSDEVRELAEGIVAEQESEIAQMADWQTEWAG